MEQIIKFTHNGVEYLGVCVPDVHRVSVVFGGIVIVNTLNDSYSVNLPAGNYEILFTLSEATEEQAETLFPEYECPNQWCEGGYIDGGYGDKWRCESCQQKEDNESYYKDELRSRIRSLGGDDTKEWVLLRKL